MAQTNIDIDKKYVRMKKDVYEHLAKTFLDKKNKKSLKKKNQTNYIVALIVFCIIFFLLRYVGSGKNVFSKSLYLIQDKTPIAIEYDFSMLGSAKTRVLSFNLNNVDINGFNFLKLSLRTEDKTKTVTTIKVQIENSLLEKDSQYLSGINNRWRHFSLPLRNFKLINEWKSVKSLTFIVEDWNVSSKKGKIYIDEVSFAEK